MTELIEKQSKEETTDSLGMIEILGDQERVFCAKNEIHYVFVKQAIRPEKQFPIEYPRVEIVFRSSSTMFQKFDDQKDAEIFWSMIVAAHRAPGDSVVNVKDVWGNENG